ncbi:MAG TPA: metalloregulator ArsR/SmtB family transcription factor [Acidimicrobiales bacterium]|nr:metalloregulator ArsR/SmtB family transcription factor [Acidimicrobiales bacterium]
MIQACEALADPIRAEIVERLARGDLTAGEIAGGFAVSRPAVSRHLRVLRECGLVTYEPHAQQRVYRLNRQPLHELNTWIAGRLDALGDHLDDMARQRRGR